MTRETIRREVAVQAVGALVAYELTAGPMRHICPQSIASIATNAREIADAVVAELERTAAKVTCVDPPQDKPATRYDWSTAPEWAMWAATDEDGEAYWYARYPAQRESGKSRSRWDSSGLFAWAHKSTSPCDWRQSLEARPK